MIVNMLRRMMNYTSMLLAIIRGTYYIIYYRVFADNVKIKFPFLAYASVNIQGPGQVSIGKRCSVVKNVFKGLTIITFTKEASISIGNQCLLGGLTIRCYSSVNIGNKLMAAISLIQDVIIVNESNKLLSSEQTNSSWNVASPIQIGNNVWIGAFANVLGGSIVGNDSVLAAYSTLYKLTIDNGSLYSGNFKRPLPIEKIIAMRA